MKVSFLPAKVELKDFDWKLNFDESDFVGIEGHDLKFSGVGVINHKEGDQTRKEFVKVEGPITKMKASFEAF